MHPVKKGEITPEGTQTAFTRWAVAPPFAAQQQGKVSGW